MRKLFTLSIAFGCIACEDYEKMFLNEFSEEEGVSVEVDSVDREYRIYVPQSRQNDEQMPVLFAFHGGGGRGYAFPQQEGFEQLAEENGFVVVYPLSEHYGSNEGEWQLNSTQQTQQDINFIQSIIDDLSAQYSIDHRKLYATGYSLGSMFTYELACQMSDQFAAMASFAGTMPVNPDSCNVDRPVPILHLHGVDDDIISYDHQWDWKNWSQVGTMHDIPGLISFWQNEYSCQDETQTQTRSGTHFVYDQCDGGSRVEHYRLNQGGHFWPEDVNGVPTYEVMWSFMSQFSND
jgi:polyhydroxybutyrate depolymerase